MSLLRELKDQIDRGCIAQLELLRSITIDTDKHEAGTVILVWRTRLGYTWVLTPSFVVPSTQLDTRLMGYDFLSWDQLINRIEGTQTSSRHWLIVSH